MACSVRREVVPGADTMQPSKAGYPMGAIRRAAHQQKAAVVTCPVASLPQSRSWPTAQACCAAGEANPGEAKTKRVLRKRGALRERETERPARPPPPARVQGAHLDDHVVLAVHVELHLSARVAVGQPQLRPPQVYCRQRLRR